MSNRIVAAATFLAVGVHGYYPGNMTSTLNRFAFGSCNDQSKHQMLWPVITAKDPQLWLWLGDNIYGDIRIWDTSTPSKGVFRPAPPDVLAAKYQQQLGHPDYKLFRERFPIIGIWDDHDYGCINDGDKTYRYRQESQQLFLDFLDEPQSSPRRLQEGIYTSYVVGSGAKRVKFILLDNRGDVHFAEINQVRCGDSFHVTEISSSGMTHAWKLMNRIVGPGFTLANMILPWHFRARPREYYASFNFGDVVLDWTASPPTATASVYGKDGLVKLRQVVPAERYTGDAPAACGPIHHVSPASFFLLQVAVSIVLVAFVASILVNAVVVVVVPLQLLWRLVGFVRAPKFKRD
ncbi:hypothetical protein AaE_013750 [Aphanomyces astaci]|uniref:PhoD-like phosphatase metallophosphatase domain-containing protein n=2 Tax=Aphanomyces astaci TaxID=112090 RepID=A0A6A4Z2Q0_APHAT|nr:hypothetical protein AaE_013750 [Aphanomyces astaci]